ncbi:MAG TPA: hypothetical protein VIJ52_07660 [Pseudolabrys sp.]
MRFIKIIALLVVVSGAIHANVAYAIFSIEGFPPPDSNPRSGQPVVPAGAQSPVKSEVAVSKEAGSTRLSFRFERPVSVSVRTANSGKILVLEFNHPVELQVGQLSESAPDLISAARTDPDGSALRFALKQKVNVRTFPSNDSFILDLMPE